MVGLATIVNLRLKNFKSFRKAEIPFAQGFTAIAGPNASGKSNVVDALLFSMGITSLRLLRAAKLTELVNHDATEGYAKVELTIKDNSGREIGIVRMVDRTGKSVYKLDGKRKTANEIQSLLLELGINPNGHNIVVQGDITRVIEMNAKQRRQVIEEVAGLQEFEEKKEEAVKKLGKVEQKVKDAHLILNEREEYLKRLEQDRENALRYNSLTEETKRSKATILSEELKIIKRELETGKEKLSKMQKEVEDKRSERNRLQDEERELESKVDEATRSLIAASEKTYSSLGKEVEQKRGHINLIAERMNSRRQNAEARRQKVLALREELKLTKKTMQGKQEELESAMEEAEKAKALFEGVKRQIDSRGPKFDKKAAEIKEGESKLSELLSEISLLKDKSHKLELARHGLEKEAKGAEHALRDLENAHRSTEAKMRAKEEIERKIAALEKKSPVERLAAKEKELEKIGSEMHALHGRSMGMQEELETLSRSKAQCPVCEKPLEAERKENIRSKKTGEMNSANAKIRDLQERRGRCLAEKDKLRLEEKEYLDLKSSLKAYAGVSEEHRSLYQSIAAYKETVAGSLAPKGLAEERELAKKIALLEKEKAIVEDKIRGQKESETSLEMNTLLQKLHESSAIRNEKESLSAKLETEIEKVLSARIGAIASETGAAEAEATELEKGISAMEAEMKAAEKSLAEMEAELEKANKANKLLEQEKERLTAKISAISEKREQLSAKIESREKDMNELNIEMSKNEVHEVDLEEESREYASIEPFREFSLNELKKRLPEIEKEITSMGAINMKSLENFDAFKKEVDDVRQKATKLDEERLAVAEMIQKIEVRKLDVFMECFNHIAHKFSDLYFKFFSGEGRLDLSDKLNPLEGGLLIQAKYKEEVLKSIDAMSGGEKSLTALAFLFAIQSYHPAPFYIFDEVDAALDKENSVKIGNLIKGQSRESQFIAISHNDAVINQADQIIGVALNKQKSSVIGLRLRKGGQEASAEQPGETPPEGEEAQAEE